MEFITEGYYRVHQILLIILGIWPYNDTAYRRIQRIFFPLLFLFSIFLQVGKIITSASNLETLLQLLSFAVPCVVVTIKYTTFCIKSEDMKRLIEQINHHWNSIKCKEELKILQQCSYITKLMTFTIIAVFYSGLSMFLTSQILPKFLDIVAPLNESRPIKLLALATLFFDQEKYFVPIFIHMTTALFVETTTIVATESMCVVYIQHASGLFKITRFFDFFNSCFEISYFLLFVLGVCSLSINMFRFFQAGFKKEIEELFSIGILVIIHFVYMFILNMMAQIVTNDSTDVFYKTCDLPWYSVPLRLQKLLQPIMQRSTKSCKFTLNSVFTASLEFFASLVSCSLSYFMVFWSLQH